MGLSRLEFFSRLGVLKIVDPLVDEAYERDELRIFLEDADSNPHGHHWHTSFHASEFPGDDPYACERAALYGLMNVPARGPVDRQGRHLMDGGKNAELELVRRFGRMGWLLSADQTAGEEFQTNFEDPVTWLSGSPDIIVIPPGWDRPHVVECKGKYVRRWRGEMTDQIALMKKLEVGPTPRHVRQLKTYIGMANRVFHKRYPTVFVCEDTWAIATGITGGMCRIHGGDACLRRLDLKPVRDGTLYYFSLDDPTNNHEFVFSHDEAAFSAGRARLAKWREDFEAGVLPPRPDDWMWSKEPFPCRFCPYKKEACKPDDKAGVDRLADSHGVTHAQSVRPSYDYEQTRERVLSRWKEEAR